LAVSILLVGCPLADGILCAAILGSSCSIFSFLCGVCISLFVLLSFFFWALFCLFFWLLFCYLQTLLITLLLSSNSSDYSFVIFKLFWLLFCYLQTLLILWADYPFGIFKLFLSCGRGLFLWQLILFCRVVCHFSYLWFLIFKEIEIISDVGLTFWKVAAIKLSGNKFLKLIQ
jgi:hypothetical protein